MFISLGVRGRSTNWRFLSSIFGVSGTLEKIPTLWTETANSWTSLVVMVNHFELVFTAQERREPCTTSTGTKGFRLKVGALSRTVSSLAWKHGDLSLRSKSKIVSSTLPDAVPHHQLILRRLILGSKTKIWKLRNVSSSLTHNLVITRKYLQTWLHDPSPASAAGINLGKVVCGM